jgi:hypothetical protein
MKKLLNVPYHSQFLEVEDYFWNIRSCGGSCIKMILDFYNIKSESILHIMNEAFNTGGYHTENGFIHDWAVEYINKKLSENNIDKKCFRKEGLESVEELIKNIDQNNPVIVSIEKITLEQTKYHLIVLTGYEYEIDENNNEKIIKIIYHESESTDPERGMYRVCDVDVFKKYWRNKAIFVN